MKLCCSSLNFPTLTIISNFYNLVRDALALLQFSGCIDQRCKIGNIRGLNEGELTDGTETLAINNIGRG